MKHAESDSSGVTLHQILTIFDDVRRKILKETSAPLQKKLYGLTLRQGSAINKVMLLTKETPNGVALNVLAQHMQMAVSATSILVESIVSKGLFVRTQNPNDRRAVCIRLSDKGEQVFREANALILAEMSKISTILTKEELSTLNNIAVKLNKFTFPTATGTSVKA